MLRAGRSGRLIGGHFLDVPLLVMVRVPMHGSRYLPGGSGGNHAMYVFFLTLTLQRINGLDPLSAEALADNKNQTRRKHQK